MKKRCAEKIETYSAEVPLVVFVVVVEFSSSFLMNE